MLRCVSPAAARAPAFLVLFDRLNVAVDVPVDARQEVADLMPFAVLSNIFAAADNFIGLSVQTFVAAPMLQTSKDGIAIGPLARCHG